MANTDKRYSDNRLLCEITSDRDYGKTYAHFRAELVYAANAEELARQSSAWRRYVGWREDWANDLTISAQANDGATDSDLRDRETSWYAFDVTYRGAYSVDLERAETMVRTLKRINRKLETMQATLGYAPDLNAYLPRVAIALGCDKARPFVVKVDAAHDHTGTGYREMSPVDFAWWSDRQLAEIFPRSEVAANI